MSRMIRGSPQGRAFGPTDKLEREVVPALKIQPPAEASVGAWGEGLLRSAGGLADDPDWDRLMLDLALARRNERRWEEFAP